MTTRPRRLPPTPNPAARISRAPVVGARIAIRLHRNGLGPATTSWLELVDRVHRDRPDSLSVDVFDTCLVRDLVGDQSIEHVIDHHHEPADGDAARRRVADRLEADLCRPVPGVADALAAIRSAGTSVLFLSDTERTSDALEAILRAGGLFVDGDRIVASWEAGATKAEGDLFDVVWGDTARSGRSVWHVGNCPWSDLTMANRAGLTAHRIDWAEPTRYEAAMAARPGTAGPALAGAARAARLSAQHAARHAARPPVPSHLHVLGSQVAGQAFGAFLLWLADEARASGIDQLWFLSRDGELPYRMASAMPADHWDGITLGYLHCSRWSWFLGGAVSYGLDRWLAAGTADDTAFIHAHRHDVPLHSLLGRIGLDPADLSDHPALAALPADVPLPPDAVVPWEALLADPAIHTVIRERATARHDLIVDYVAGLGLAPGHAGLVDVGWRGRLAWAMSPILEEVTGFAPVHFHLGGSEVLADAEAEVDIRRFAFDPARPSPIANPVACVETFAASGRARVVGYERQPGGEVVPVFDGHLPDIDNADRRELWAGALATARELPSRAELEGRGLIGVSLADEAVAVLDLWWNRPDPVEVDAMRGLSFEDDDNGQAVRPVVNPYSLQELTGGPRRPRLWQQGSATASTRAVGLAARIARRLPRSVRSHAPRRLRRLVRRGR